MSKHTRFPDWQKVTRRGQIKRLHGYAWYLGVNTADDIPIEITTSKQVVTDLWTNHNLEMELVFDADSHIAVLRMGTLRQPDMELSDESNS